jgi:hypothetical protein
MYVLISLIISVLTLAGLSIGIKCMNDSKKEGSSKTFLIVMLVLTLLGLLGSMAQMYLTRGV